MRKTFVIGMGLVCTALSFATVAKADAVVSDTSRCGGDGFVLAAPDGYALIEWAGGQAISKGDTILGDVNSVGRKDVATASGARLSIFIENYGLSQAAATQALNARCGKAPATFP